MHFSEQQFWLDLQRETESILHKITTALSQPLLHPHSSSYQNTHGGGFASELTIAERRKVEKWVETMSARPAVMTSQTHGANQKQHPPAGPVVRKAVPPMDFSAHGTAQAGSAPPNACVQDSRNVSQGHYDPRAPTTNTRASEYGEQFETDDVPLSLHMDFPSAAFSPHHEGASTTSSVTQSPYNPAHANSRHHPHDLYYEMGQAKLEFQTPGGLASRHQEMQPTPLVSAHTASHTKTSAKGASNTPHTLRGSSKENSTSFVRPTAETLAALKYTGLREENNRDVFYKSLRSSADSAPKPTSGVKTRPTPARAQQSIAAEFSSTPHSASARVVTAESQFASQTAAGSYPQTRAPPALPYESKGNFPTAKNSFRIQAAKKDEPELTRERAVSTTGANTPASHNVSSKSRTGSHNPPPLPAQLASNGNKIDLSIFKRARTDIVYQGEMRNETSNKLQQTAANINEKVGFMSGKQRKLKF